MSEKIIKDQEETKEETKIGSEEIVKMEKRKPGLKRLSRMKEKKCLRKWMQIHRSGQR